MKGLAAELREETRLLHERLDAALPLVDPALTREQYVTFLSQFLAWLRPTERAVSDCIGDRFTLPLRSRAPRIAADLAACGTAEPPDAPDTMRPALECEAHAVGCVYVIEGAALGGQLIARHVKTTLGITAANGGSYYAGDPCGVGSRWRDVKDALDRYEAAPPLVIDGARRTFESLLRWLA